MGVKEMRKRDDKVTPTQTLGGAKGQTLARRVSLNSLSPSTTMPLEATVIIIDNSEYMRNGDYTPTRFEAQSDAVTTVFGHKVDSNPENTVGLMSMAGKGY